MRARASGAILLVAALAWPVAVQALDKGSRAGEP